jgi:hypothetical protein
MYPGVWTGTVPNRITAKRLPRRHAGGAPKARRHAAKSTHRKKKG